MFHARDTHDSITVLSDGNEGKRGSLCQTCHERERNEACDPHDFASYRDREQFCLIYANSTTERGIYVEMISSGPQC